MNQSMEEYLSWSGESDHRKLFVEDIESKENDPWKSKDPIYFEKFPNGKTSDFVLQNTVKDI